MSPVLRAGLVAPAIVAAVAALAWLSAGAAWAAGVLGVGLGAIIAHHLWHLDRLARWSAASLDAAVPEGSGPWRAAMTALYRRVRSRTAHQRDLLQTIERFTSAAEAIPEGMVVLDDANRIRWANARAQQFFGLDLAHDLGAPLVNLVRQPEVIHYLEAGDYSEPIVVDSQRIPGLTLSIQMVPFGIAERLLMSRDITRLESVARMRRDFIANVSHELKTPLTVVTGFLETLQDLALEPRQRERYMNLMAVQARSMERLVDDLLTLSALESEQNVPAEVPFAVVPLLQSLVSEGKALSAGAHSIALEIDAPATVNGSRDELASAFGNLVTNAIRYTPAGGTITLSWRRAEDGGALYAVRDTGIGIASEHLPRLTERFYRVDRSRSRATGGTGLGLAIVKHVLIRHQATLAIDSETGRGSTFTVKIPARRVEWSGDAGGNERGASASGATAADALPAITSS
jgi:two-component system phosphate regulon sensor histidine kinase PhoR